MPSQPPRRGRVFILSVPGSEIFFDTRTNEIQSRIPSLRSKVGAHVPQAAPKAGPQRPAQ